MNPIDEILDIGRATRKRTPQVIWLTAMLVGAACAIGFVIILFTDPAATESPRLGSRQPPSFLTGLLIGLAVGASVGLALGRYRRAAVAPDHSAANSP